MVQILLRGLLESNSSRGEEEVGDFGRGLTDGWDRLSREGRREAGSRGSKAGSAAPGEDVRGPRWGQGPAGSGDRRRGSRSGRAADTGCSGLALHQIWAQRGDTALCPPVERRERCEGQEGQKVAGTGAWDLLGHCLGFVGCLSSGPALLGLHLSPNPSRQVLPRVQGLASPPSQLSLGSLLGPSS